MKGTFNDLGFTKAVLSSIPGDEMVFTNLVGTWVFKLVKVETEKINNHKYKYVLMEGEEEEPNVKPREDRNPLGV